MNSLVKNRSKRIISCVMICCLLLLGITGCNNPIEQQQTQDNSKSTQETANQPVPVLNSEQNRESMDINDFKPIQLGFIKYDFKVTLNGTKAKPISFLVEGKYDLNQDGRQEHITILSRGDYDSDTEVETYIKINKSKQDFYMSFTNDGEVRLIDLDKNDKFIEVAVFDEGPSGDPSYTIYRYDGEVLYRLGEVDGRALMNGEGKLLPSSFVSHFTPKFYSAWFEIRDNAFMKQINDIKVYLGSNYQFEGGEAYFIPTNEMPKEFMPIWEKPIQFIASDVKIIDVYLYSPENRALNFYFVEFPDGQKGMLYFWMGD